MSTRPILFGGPMVRALLAGTKTQTRRMVKPSAALGDPARWPRDEMVRFAHKKYEMHCPFGVAGDRLWARESCGLSAEKDAVMYADGGGKIGPTAKPGSESWAREWRSCPSIHMPRWASRLTLEVTGVRVERLQAISEEDAKAEGVEPLMHESWSFYDPLSDCYPSTFVEPTPEFVAEHRLENVRHHGPSVVVSGVDQFARLWDSFAPEGARWADSPWVWCVSFTRVEGEGQ